MDEKLLSTHLQRCQWNASELRSQLDGISELFMFFAPDAEIDYERLRGVGFVLQGMATKARALGRNLDGATIKNLKNDLP